MKKFNVYLLVIVLSFIAKINAQDTVSINPTFQLSQKDSTIKKEKFLYSFYFNYCHYSYKDNDSINLSKLLNKKGTSGFGLGVSAVYLFPNNLLSLGLSADISILPAKYNNNNYLWDSYHDGDIINYDAYIQDYSLKYNEMPANINVKAALYPHNVVSPFIEFGLCYKTITFYQKGIYTFSSPYDSQNSFELPFEHKFTSGSFCFKPTIGVNLRAGKNISMFAKVSYLKAKYEEESVEYKHRDIVYTNNPGHNQATNNFILVFPKGYYEGWLLSFGLSYNFSDFKFRANKIKVPLF